MTLRHMHIFLTLCDCDCNMTRAAGQLFLSQPAISQAVSELEQHYGVRLFERISRRLYLTEAGKEYRAYASHIHSLYDQMEKGLRNWESAGVLRVGSSITIGSQLLPHYVRAYQARYPQTEVQVWIGPSGELEKKLLDNALDFALIEGAVHQKALLAEPYMEDSLACICSAHGPFEQGQRVDINTFKQQRFLLREPGSGTREAFDQATQAAGFTVQPLWEGMSTSALVNAAVLGLGVAVLPSRMVAQALRRGKVRTFEVEGMSFQRMFQMVWHKDKFISPGMEQFLQLCRCYELDYPAPKFDELA